MEMILTARILLKYLTLTVNIESMEYLLKREWPHCDIQKNKKIYRLKLSLGWHCEMRGLDIVRIIKNFQDVQMLQLPSMR